MCGILGLINDGKPVNEHSLELLAHRGPDANGSESVSTGGRRVWLAHTRLSILDLSSAGAQPMYSRNGRWLITFNGEIYNHISIRNELGGEFRGHSDTETLVESLARNGLHSTLKSIEGMFAFAALDIVEGKLHLVRDPFGIKPVYYTDGNDFAFSSEIKPLAALTGINPEPDAHTIQTFLTLRFVPSPHTIYANVKRLSPGHVLSFDIGSGKIDRECYARPQTEVFRGSFSEACDCYKDKLEEVVAGQLLSDVPVGVLLSGGIDSALVAAMAARHKKGLKAFTVGFEGDVSECEISDAAETAAILGIGHDFIRLSPDDLLNSVQLVAEAVEEPLGTTSMLAMWHLAALARRDVTVVLTGQGSDEPWGGYLLYQSELLRSMLPFPQLISKLGKGLQSVPKVPDFLCRGLNMFGVANEAERFCEARALFTSEERESLTGDSSSGDAVSSISSWTGWMKGAEISSAERMMRVDTHMNLPDDLLLYGDKITMAVSLEARVPMLDSKLVNFIESLPLAYRVKLGRRKIVHKEMALKYLPSAIVNRSKKGFKIPFGTLAKTDWKEYLEGILLSDRAKYLSVINKKGVRNIWDRHQNGHRDCARQLFALMMLAMCFENIEN